MTEREQFEAILTRAGVTCHMEQVDSRDRLQPPCGGVEVVINAKDSERNLWYPGFQVIFHSTSLAPCVR